VADCQNSHSGFFRIRVKTDISGCAPLTPMVYIVRQLAVSQSRLPLYTCMDHDNWPTRRGSGMRDYPPKSAPERTGRLLAVRSGGIAPSDFSWIDNARPLLVLIVPHRHSKPLQLDFTSQVRVWIVSAHYKDLQRPIPDVTCNLIATSIQAGS
jgi:hypothetical protein